MSPYFSIIVPVYNSSQYLDRCIDSILSQTYNDFELILVDDGSTDESGNICDVYAQKDKRIRVFHKTNGGVSSARNKGIKEANGEYAIFVDSDDYILPEKLEKTIYYCKNYPDFIVGLYLVPETYKYDLHTINLQDYTYINHVGVVWTSTFRVQVMKNNHILFDENICHGEDSLFIINFFSYCKTIIFIDEFGYIYEKGHENGLNNIFQTWEKELYVYDKISCMRYNFLKRLNHHPSKILPLPYFKLGEILRVIKSIYLNPSHHSHKFRLKALKETRLRLNCKQEEQIPFNSNKIIYLLLKHKMYLALDCFMFLWEKRNK